MEPTQRAALVVASAGAAGELARTTEAVHGALCRRARSTWSWGPLAAVLAVHRLHVKAICRFVGVAAGAVSFGGAQAVHHLERRRSEGVPLAPEPGLGAAAACAFGDLMVGPLAHLAPRLAVHHDGRPLRPDPLELRRAFGHASPRVVVFLHGLGDTERGWSKRGGLPELVDSSGTHTAVLIRYNGGLHISENGERLAELLRELQWAWPQPIEEIIFVGHSMGGLIARSACEQARRCQMRWRQLVTHVLYLGVPHHGSAVERVAAAGIRAIERVPETRPLAALANRRSAGIKDLRYGSIVREDWEGHPDERHDHLHADVPLLPSARHHHVAAAILPERLRFADHLVGDIMVPLSSAHGSARRPSRRPFPQEDAHVLRGSTHPGLMGHDRTRELVRDLLGMGAPLGEG